MHIIQQVNFVISPLDLYVCGYIRRRLYCKCVCCLFNKPDPGCMNAMLLELTVWPMTVNNFIYRKQLDCDPA